MRLKMAQSNVTNSKLVFYIICIKVHFSGASRNLDEKLHNNMATAPDATTNEFPYELSLR